MCFSELRTVIHSIGSTFFKQKYFSINLSFESVENDNNKKQGTGSKFQYAILICWFLFKTSVLKLMGEKANKTVSKSQAILYANLYFPAAVVFFSSFYLHKLAFSLAKSLLMALQHLRDKNGKFQGLYYLLVT